MPNEDPIIITETAPDGTTAEFEVVTAQAGEDTAEGSLAEEVVDALFDDGAPEISAVYADTDGDGSIDLAAADTDADGQIDTVVGDTDGDGKVDTGVTDLDGDGDVDLVAVDTDGDGLLDVAVADTDGDGEFDTLMEDANGDGEFELAEAVEAEGEDAGDYTLEAESGLPTEEEISTNSVEFNLGSEGFSETVAAETSFETDAGVSSDAVSATSDDAYLAEPAAPDDVADPALAEQAASAEAAREAQEASDQFVAEGDYAAAAQARETAEDAAWAAGDSSMLGASDSADLAQAAYQQETAAEYREQQAEHIAAGDYEAAKEDAQNAAYATGDADYLASGSDHTGQSDQDAYNLGNAVSDEKNAEYFADNAEWYAEAGNMDAAESSAAHAVDYQASADNYADQADPTSVGYDVDPSSAVDVGGSYDAGMADAGGYDMSAVDTGMDAGVDTSTPSYDAPVDDGTV